jgi:hypothetical protein
VVENSLDCLVRNPCQIVCHAIIKKPSGGCTVFAAFWKITIKTKYSFFIISLVNDHPSDLQLPDTVLKYNWKKENRSLGELINKYYLYRRRDSKRNQSKLFLNLRCIDSYALNRTVKLFFLLGPLPGTESRRFQPISSITAGKRNSERILPVFC